MIDSLRQAVNVIVSLEAVRQALRERFPDGAQRVEASNFLTLDFHGLAALDFILQLGQGRPPGASAHYTVICVDLGHIGNGDVVGTGPMEIRIARVHGNHFVPLIRRWAR